MRLRVVTHADREHCRERLGLLREVDESLRQLGRRQRKAFVGFFVHRRLRWVGWVVAIPIFARGRRSFVCGPIVARACGTLWEHAFPQGPTPMKPDQADGQLTLQFAPDITQQYRSLKECCAARMYQQRGGVRAVAGRLDMSPSHLSEVLGGGGDRNRKFDLDELERYISEFKDFEPILYLCAKFMGDKSAEQSAATTRVAEQLETLMQSLAQAGFANKGTRRR